MEILENGSYHRRLLMYKGLEKPETLLDPANADGLTIATQGYGVGNWYFVTGNRARAREIFEKVVAGDPTGRRSDTSPQKPTCSG